jgi:hypothetical protein
MIPSPPPPHPSASNLFFANPSCSPAGVEDDGDRPRALRLPSGWLLPSIHWPWDPLIDHDIK